MPGIVPNISQTAAEISTLISLVAAHMGIAILPASAVEHSVASVIALVDIVRQGDNPMSEICIAVSKRGRTAVVDNFRFFALEKLGLAKEALCANRS